MPVRDVRRFSEEPVNRPDRKTPLQKKKRIIAILKKVGIYALIVAVICAFMYFLLFIYSYKKVSVIGNEKVSANEISNIIESYFNKPWYQRFFSNPILIPVSAIETDVKAFDFTIDRVEVNHNYTDLIDPTLSVILKERQEAAYWCGVNNQECLVVDESGFAFKAAWPENQSFVIYERERPTIGTYFEDSAIDFNKLLSVSVRLVQIISTKEDADEVIRIAYIANHQYQFTTKKGVVIKMDVSSDIEKQMMRLKQIWENPEVRTSQYIDLRFGNKIFYKPTSAQNTEVATSTIAL